jgi:hypothetical protein
VKGTLGPWYRPASPSASVFASSSRMTTEMVPPSREGLSTQSPRATSPRNVEISSASATSVSLALGQDQPLSSPVLRHEQGSSIPRPSTNSRLITPDMSSDLASYFPPDNAEDALEDREVVEVGGDAASTGDARMSGQGETGRHRSALFQSYNLHHDGYSYSYPSVSSYALHSNPLPGAIPSSSSSVSPSHVPAVAPLNISTTLHRTLLTLRESIVTLSNAVDSLARRQDVAMATEAMRMNEEIRSLRGVIHGLRMQVGSSFET